MYQLHRPDQIMVTVERRVEYGISPFGFMEMHSSLAHQETKTNVTRMKTYTAHINMASLFVHSAKVLRLQVETVAQKCRGKKQQTLQRGSF